MEVLTVVNTRKVGNWTYNLLSNGLLHINNHKTNDKSIVAPQPPIELLTKKESYR